MNVATPAITNVWQGSTALTIESQSVSFAVTPWTQVVSGQTLYETTLTIYGDVVLSGISETSNVFYFHVASSSGSSYQFLNISQSLSSSNFAFWFEQNPASIIYTSNANDALLQTQIAQNEVMIQNQERTNELLEQQQQQNQQDRSDVQDASDSADTNADTAQTQNEATTSNLLNLMGSFIQALQTPATNCQIPADLGNLNLGTIDFCTGKPTEFVPIINTISALVMSFAIYLVARHLVHSFIRITVFAQGGKE